MATISRMAKALTPPATSPFATIEEALDDIRAGKFVVVVDDEDRENEGDLTIAAEFATSDAVNFMATHARGLICLCLTPERCRELGLRQMTDHNETPNRTAFTVSIEAREGVSRISAHDRARTIQAAIDPASGPDLVQPGVFPLEARPGGVLQRAGQTEAAVDLARLAGLTPAGVVCEVMNEDGTMARVPDLAKYCGQHGIKLISVADLIEYRRRTEKLIERVVTVNCPRRTATSPRSRSASCSRASSTSRSCAASSRIERTSSSVSTRSVSPATCSTRCAATAASSWSSLCARSSPRGAACCCTWPRRAAASSC